MGEIAVVFGGGGEVEVVGPGAEIFRLKEEAGVGAEAGLDDEAVDGVDAVLGFASLRAGLRLLDGIVEAEVLAPGGDCGEGEDEDRSRAA